MTRTGLVLGIPLATVFAATDLETAQKTAERTAAHFDRASYREATALHRQALGVLPLAVSAAADTPPPTPQRVKLNIIRGRPVVDDVFLNGHGPYRFLLDTGGETNQVEAALARSLGFTATYQVELQTMAGPYRAAGGRLGYVSLGPAKATNQEFLITSLDGLHALSDDIRGILGQSFLANFDLTFDFRNLQLVFGGPPPAGPRVRFRLIHGRIAIPTNHGDLVLDSGTDTLTLFRYSSQLRLAQVRGSSGATASVFLGRAPVLHISGRKYRSAVAMFGLPRLVGEGGLLPASLFQAIFICNSEGYVVIDPETRR
jgi:hypothetical protein